MGLLDTASTWLGDNANLVSTGGALVGQYLASNAAKDAAAAQMNIAAQAADMSKFTPYGITTGYGTSWFDTEKQTAGYELDPALAAYRDKLLMMGSEALPTSMDTGAAAQQYYQDIQSMMAPQRAAEQAQLQQNLFGSGRLGMRLAGEGAGAGAGGMVQPDIFGYNKAQELANQQLAMQARSQAQAEMDAAIGRGTGLWQTGLGVEQLGMTPLTLGAELGGRATSGNQAAATALMQGGQAAAQANLASGVGWSNTLKDIGLGMLKYN
jgi:hypothetical protein